MSYTPVVRGLVKQDEPMSKHTSWRVGGKAKTYFEPADLDDLCEFMAQLPDDEPLLWIGLGSNLLVRDGGFEGTVIGMSGAIDQLELMGETRVRTGAGVACPKVARFCANHGLAGAEFLAGIPGTMGGALAMNAGAFGGETWDIVATVETVDRQGVRHIRSRDDYLISYRSVQASHEEWFLMAELNLHKDHRQQAQARIRELLDKRSTSQPMGQASCGSVFRNPPNDYAARLIEACGLKGYRIGDACVSDKHANFIVNLGTASACDIEQLIRHIQETVRNEQGVELVPEVCIMGKTLNQSV